MSTAFNNNKKAKRRLTDLSPDEAPKPLTIGMKIKMDAPRRHKRNWRKKLTRLGLIQQLGGKRTEVKSAAKGTAADKNVKRGFMHKVKKAFASVLRSKI